MPDARHALRGWITRLNELADLPTDVAPDVAEAAKREVVSLASAGKAPDGQPWPKTKDGHRPLQNGAKAMTARAVGSSIVLRLTGHYARHHLGAVRGGVKRQILPSGKIPAPITEAIRKVVSTRFHDAMGGA